MARRMFGSSSSREPRARLRPSLLSEASRIKTHTFWLKKAIIYLKSKTSGDYIVLCKTAFNMVQTCVVTPPAGLWGVAAASKAVQTQHVSSATWPVPATVLLLKTSLVIENISQKLLGLMLNKVSTNTFVVQNEATSARFTAISWNPISNVCICVCVCVCIPYIWFI